MSVCPHCGRHVTSSQSPCSHCQESRGDIFSESIAQSNRVIEPEIVSSEQKTGQEFGQCTGQGQGRGQGCEQNFGKTAQGGIRFITWRNGQYGQREDGAFGNNSGMHGFTTSTNSDACLPGIITLVWAIAIGVQFGILASIGFFVFYGIISAFSLAITVRRTMQGQYTPAWLRRGLVWIISAGITIGLAGGF